MIHQVGALRRPAGLLSVSWTVTGSIKIKQDTTLDQDIVTIPVADWPALRNAIDAAIEARQNTQGADAVSEAQSLTTQLDAHADWLEHVKEMPKNAELIRQAVSRIKQLEVVMTETLGPLERCELLAARKVVEIAKKLSELWENWYETEGCRKVERELYESLFAAITAYNEATK